MDDFENDIYGGVTTDDVTGAVNDPNYDSNWAPVEGVDDQNYTDTPWGSLFGDNIFSRFLSGTASGQDKALATLGFGIASLASALRNKPPEVKMPVYKEAPVYNRALTAPMFPPQPAPTKSASGQNIYQPMVGLPTFFNPNPFQFDPTEAAKRYGPTPEQIAAGRAGYEAGLASLYKPLSITPIQFQSGATSNTSTTGDTTGTTGTTGTTNTTGGTTSTGGTTNTTGGTSGAQTGIMTPSSVKYGNIGIIPSGYIGGMTPEQYAPYITPYEQYASSLANELKPGQFDFELTPRQMLAGTTNPDVVVAPTNWNSMTTDQRNAWVEQNAPASKYAAPQRLPQGVHDWVVANFIRDNRMNFDEYKNALGSITDVDFSKLPESIQDALLYTEKYQLPRGVVHPEYVDESKFFQFKRADGSVQPMSPTIFYSTPATQVGYLNTIKVTPDELLANGFTQDQINVFKNTGYKSGLAEGGAVDDIYDGYKEGGDVYEFAKGNYLKGPGDGMSDSIEAYIEGGSTGDGQPARLARNEFVIPADVVADLGNGSSDAGAEALYEMMDRIRMARHDTKEQPPAVNVDKILPA